MISFAKKFFLPAVIVLFISACENEEVIPGNEAPPDQTIEDVTIRNYVNRVYVTVLGREAETTELEGEFNLLRSNNLSMQSRLQFLGDVFAESEYRPHLYDRERLELLNNLDTAEINNQIFVFNYILGDTSFQYLWEQAEYELARLDSLNAVPNDLAANTLSFENLQRRCIDNYFYDQINMGTENFVVSCFQHFLDRYPTDYELTQSKNMVNGAPAIVFLQSGQSKTDFMNIFLSSTNYKEGLVLNLYRRFLLRAPTSVEMGNATAAYQLTYDYEQMQKDILATNEYIGLE